MIPIQKVHHRLKACASIWRREFHHFELKITQVEPNVHSLFMGCETPYIGAIDLAKAYGYVRDVEVDCIDGDSVT